MEGQQANEIQDQTGKYCKEERSRIDVPDASGRETDREMVRMLARDCESRVDTEPEETN